MREELAPAAAAHVAAANERALGGWTPAALLFFSGAIALVYETLWLRSFSASFGATAPTAAATISAVLCGLALGSAWLGPRSTKWARPLRTYALLELGAALLALAVPLEQRLWSSATTFALEQLGDSAALAVRVLAVFVALLPPTFLLGGTLPVLARIVDDRTDATGARCGRLYAANTAGAVLGVLAVPFVLLPALGAAHSYRLAIAGSVALAVAAAAVDLARGAPASALAAPSTSRGERPPRLLALAAASGFLVLGLEVAWMRMLAQVHPNSVHAFAIVLGTFLAALAIGAWLGTAAVRRTRDPWRLLQRIWSGAGLLVLATPASFVFLTRGLAELADGSRGDYVLDLVRVCSLAFAPAAVCAGMALPVLIALATAGGRPAPEAIGSLLAWNTAGSVVGPLVATFALFPWLGVWGTTAALGLGLAVLPLLAGRGTSRALIFSPVLGIALAAHALTLPRVHVDNARGEELVWLREGAHGIVSALREGPTLRLALDNSYVLGGTGSRGDARVLGHLPLLLHGAPRSVAFLGLGTGITASAALEHGVEEITAFELVPEVAEAARTVFAPENGHVLDDPRVRLIADDARSHLASTERRYDVVVGDLVVPWRRGESSLFTREHFAGVRRALAPGGLFCQWLPLYQMSEEELRIVAATFLDVFPEASVWRGDFVAYLPVLGLVGRADGAALAPEGPAGIDEVDRRTAALTGTLALDSRYLAHPAGLWLHYAGQLSANEPWVRAARRNTQDLPWLELLGARAPLRERAESDGCVGEPLLRFLDGLAAPQALDAEHERWRALGRELFEASWLASAGDDEHARTMAFDVLERLPPEIRASVLGPTAGEEAVR